MRRSTGIVGALLAVLVIAYVASFRSGALSAIDLDAVTNPRTGEFRSVPTLHHFLSLAWLGAGASIALLAVAVVLQAHHLGGVRVAMRTSAMVAGCFLCGEVAKWVLGAVHPFGEMTVHGASASFPSVHSAVAMVLALGLARLSPGNGEPQACAYAAGMGVFTVLAGWHFPSDVVGGCLLGAAWAIGIPRSRGRGRASAALPAIAAAGCAAALMLALLVGYGLTFGRAGVFGDAFATGALAIVAVATAAAALSAIAPGARNPRPSSGVPQRPWR